MNILLCSTKKSWANAFSESNELSIEATNCKFLKDLIYNDAFQILSVLESKALIALWKSLGKNFQFELLPPPQSENDRILVSQLLRTTYEFDPYDNQVRAILRIMKIDLIEENRLDDIDVFSWWSPTEFSEILNFIKNFPIETISTEQFLLKTGILSKTSEAIQECCLYLTRTIFNCKRFPISLPESIKKLKQAPQIISEFKGNSNWFTILKTEGNDIKNRLQVMESIQLFLDKNVSIDPNQKRKMLVDNSFEEVLRSFIKIWT